MIKRLERPPTAAEQELLREISDMVEAGMRMFQAATRLGWANGQLTSFLFRFTGSYRWPPQFDPELLDGDVAELPARRVITAEAAAQLAEALRQWAGLHGVDEAGLRALGYSAGCSVGTVKAALAGQQIGCASAVKLRGALHRRSVLNVVQGGAGADADLEARIAADQARLRAERESWLIREQQIYGLPRRGRMLEEMPV